MGHPVIDLVELRETRRLSIREAAELIGIPHMTLWRAEKGIGQPQLDTAKRIADFYSLDVFVIWPVEDRTAA